MEDASPPHSPDGTGAPQCRSFPHLCCEGSDMADQTRDALTQLSDALAGRAAAAAGFVASIHAPKARPRSGILWRPDVVVASEQVFPKSETAEIVLANGRHVAAT